MKQNIKKVHRGEIYWCDLGEAVGSEQGGCRPVIIVQNDIGNNFSTTTIVVPLTTKIKKTKLPTHHEFVNNGVKQVACAEQIRTVDKLRLGTNLGFVRKEDVDEISRCVHIAVEEIKFQPKPPYGKVDGEFEVAEGRESAFGKGSIEGTTVAEKDASMKEVIYPFVRKGEVLHASADGSGTVEKVKDSEKAVGATQRQPFVQNVPEGTTGTVGATVRKKKTVYHGKKHGNHLEQPRQEKNNGKHLDKNPEKTPRVSRGKSQEKHHETPYKKHHGQDSEKTKNRTTEKKSGHKNHKVARPQQGKAVFDKNAGNKNHEEHG